MDLKEALNIIGLPKTASEEEFKSKYKELAKKYHPDIYKENPDKFKTINEAYQLIQDYRKNPDKYEHKHNPFNRNNVSDMGGINFEEIFFNFRPNAAPEQNHKRYSYPQITINVKISFKQSVIGSENEIQYKKFNKCSKCSGKGSESIGNGCLSCNGFGSTTSNNGRLVFTKVCTKCYGKDIKIKSCIVCKETGISEVESKLTIYIPPGILDNSTLRLRGAGSYVGPGVFGDTYTDVFVCVSVDQDKDLTLEGQHVICKLKLPLLDALTGCNKDIRTIYDTRNITIPPLSKNKDEIYLHGCGVKEANGMQKIILDIEYPDKSDELINFLKEKNAV